MAETAVSILPWPEIITIGSSGCSCLSAVEQLQAVEPAALQPDVEEHEIGPARDHGGERVVAVARRAGAVAFVLQDARDQFADIGFVVDDEDIGCHDQAYPPRYCGCRARSAAVRLQLGHRLG